MRLAGRSERMRRLVVAVLCFIGLDALPAGSAPIPVSSGTMTGFRTCTLTVRGGAAVEGIDAQVEQDRPTTNTNGNDMQVASDPTKGRRAYLMFDLTTCSPQIPQGARIDSAVVRLHVSSRPSQCRTQHIFRVPAPWTESGITWNTQPDGWSALNAPADGERTSSLSVGPTGCPNAANGYVSGWDVTADVRAFLAGAPNHGWMIRDGVEGASPTQTANYRTKNANNASQSPQLIVDYTP
jgi:large repetitive protein